MSTPFCRTCSSCSKTRWAWSSRCGSPSSFTQPSRVVTFTPSESSSVFNNLRSFAYSDCTARGLSNCKVRVSVIRASRIAHHTSRLTESVNKRPVCAFLRRLLDLDDDEITARTLRSDVGRREVALLPAIGHLREFAFRIVNVDGNFRRFYFTAEPEPVFVSLEQLLADRLFLPRPEIAAPVIFANLEPFLDVGLGRLQRERLRVIHRPAARGHRDERERDRKTRTQCCLEERRHHKLKGFSS